METRLRRGLAHWRERGLRWRCLLLLLVQLLLLGTQHRNRPTRLGRCAVFWRTPSRSNGMWTLQLLLGARGEMGSLGRRRSLLIGGREHRCTALGWRQLLLLMLRLLVRRRWQRLGCQRIRLTTRGLLEALL